MLHMNKILLCDKVVVLILVFSALPLGKKKK